MPKLIWERAPQPGDEYALVLENPDAVNVGQLHELFAEVKRARGGRQLHFSLQATKAFEQWLHDVSAPLPSHAYARLSNWFLTEADVDRNSPLAERCESLWNRGGQFPAC